MRPSVVLPVQVPQLHPMDVQTNANLQWLWTQLRSILLGQAQVISLAANTSLTADYADSFLECTGTHTQTLPAAGQAGQRFYFFNAGTGVITIAGTINGNAAGYQLTNQYQYVEITSDGTQWLVTSNN